MMSALDRLTGFSNFVKTAKPHALDYRAFGKCLGDGGAG